jgi:uncharacterized protein
VLGNNDIDIPRLTNACNDIGGKINGEICEHEVDGISFGIYHGADALLKSSLIQSGKYDIIITGHSHQAENIKIGKTLFINPGAAMGWFGYNATIEIFNT